MRDARIAKWKDRAIRLPMEPETTDAIAAEAEAFFGARYGLPMNDSRVLDNGDFTVTRPGGMVTIIDVKWSPRTNASLVSRLDARVKATIYVLVVGMPGSFRIVGWCYGPRHRRHVRDIGHGPCHVTEQSELQTNVDHLMRMLGVGHAD